MATDMTPSALPLELAYRIDERLGLMEFYSVDDTPRYVTAKVRREVHAELRERWPEEYREAVESGGLTA